MAKVYFSDISERDMDMLFMEEFASSEDFLRLFTGRVGIPDAHVKEIWLSKTDPALGESDITVVVESHGERIGLLVEDKIDAVAMPQQAERYVSRGEKASKQGDFKRFFVFIVAPERYLAGNEEAQKYLNRVSYETILDYFEHFEGPRSAFKAKQLRQAIEKQKKGYQVEVDEAVTAFWQQYAAYQKANYPEVFLAYSGERKGTNALWPRFSTAIDGLYIVHKTEAGAVDLTFEGCGDRVAEIEELLSETVEDFVRKGFTVRKTGKAAAVRLQVPVLDMHAPFENQTDGIDIGLNAVKKLTDLAGMFDYRDVRELLEKE